MTTRRACHPCLLGFLLAAIATANHLCADDNSAATNIHGRAPTNHASVHAIQIRSAAEPLIAALDQLVRQKAVVGAQLALGDDAGLQLRKNFGVRSPGSTFAVDYDTLFCLGSCSKPIVASCVMALVEKSRLNLNQPIDRWLPRYGRLELVDGRPAARAPTLRELLAHRAGIFSQKETLTLRQRGLLRDFTLTLRQVVDDIAAEPLVAQPGARFAYSNAGYCVLGRVVEAATGQNLETLLYEELGQHLGWQRTTYFPSRRGSDVAEGGGRKNPLQPDRELPHALRENLRFTHVGGCLYSTATETGQFARMMLRRGKAPLANVLSEATWKTILKPPFPGQDYGLGWMLVLSEDGTATALQHTGAFASARSSLNVYLDRNLFVVIHYTLAAASDEAGPKAIPEAEQDMLTRLDHMEIGR